MSQHIYRSTYGGRPVTIYMGWDRPLQGFFLVIESEGVDGYVYSNLDDPELVSCGGLPATLGHFTVKLNELGLVVPQNIVQQVELDATNNVGNRRVFYDAAGNVLASEG